jgi:small subunit ribosomal protein S17
MSTVENTKKRGNRKERTGVVVSDCQDKTIIVEVTRRVPHKLYKKVIKRKKRFAVHDENNTATIGDDVRIVETRPLSKRKRWRLTDIIRTAEK